MPQKKQVKKQYPDPPTLNGLRTRDDLLHGKLTQDPVPSHKDTRMSDRKSWKPSGGHPAGVSEGPVEQAVKTMGAKFGTLVPEDNPYLEQYFHPDQDILEKQDLRPTRTTGKNEDWPYRKLALEKVREQDNEARKEFYDNLDNIAKKHTDPMSKEWTTAFNKGIKDVPLKDYSKYNLKGLGTYSEDQGNPNYDSVYDEWDFDTKSPLTSGNANTPGAIWPSINEYIAKTFMKRAGTPYAVYDRVPKGTLKSTRIPLQSLPKK